MTNEQPPQVQGDNERITTEENKIKTELAKRAIPLLRETEWGPERRRAERTQDSFIVPEDN